MHRIFTSHILNLPYLGYLSVYQSLVDVALTAFHRKECGMKLMKLALPQSPDDDTSRAGRKRRRSLIKEMTQPLLKLLKLRLIDLGQAVNFRR